jgi:hypothetical protein
VEGRPCASQRCEGYESLVNGLVSCLGEVNFNRSYTAGENRKRQPSQTVRHCQSWVEEDDTTAHRVYLDPRRGRGRGMRRGRGSWKMGRGGECGGGHGGGRGGSHGGERGGGSGYNSRGYKKRNFPY